MYSTQGLILNKSFLKDDDPSKTLRVLGPNRTLASLYPLERRTNARLLRGPVYLSRIFGCAFAISLISGYFAT